MTTSMIIAQQRQFKLIKGPHVSEKASVLADKHRQLVFKVLLDANKFEIKQAVEFLFNVKVSRVTLLNVKPKRRRFKQIEGSIKAWKKAYVTLQPGYDLDFIGTK